MSLLFKAADDRYLTIARQVYDEQFEKDPQLKSEYDERRKQLMYEDILYNISYLYAAKTFNDDKIFTDYARWIYHLLCHLMKDISRERIRDQMVMHYKLLGDAMEKFLSPEEAGVIRHHLNNAIRITEEEAIEFTISTRFGEGKYAGARKEYLDLLLNVDTRGAIQYIEQLIASGTPLRDVYLEVVQEAMYEVGNLWHQNKITVDMEHYCTSISQMAMAQLYPLIFSQARKGLKLLTCCVGSELHEMGVRMLADLFEYHGWDSIYLGAAVPVKAVLDSIKSNQPELVALSVTMPQHLPECHELVKAIRATFPGVKIAVGGRAFQSTDKLWEQWDVDVSANDAGQLIEWANLNIASKG